jgi:aminoglycoside phosphotransferase (APT) family kinase protein
MSAGDLALIVQRMSASVKLGLAPMAEDRYLREALYSLSAILRIVGELMASESDDRSAELASLRQALVGVDADDQSADQMRQALAEETEGLASLSEAERTRIETRIREFLSTDLSRPHAALLRWESEAPAGPATSTTRPDRSTLNAHVLSTLAKAGVSSPDATISFDEQAPGGYSADTLIGMVTDGTASRQVAARIQWPDGPMSRLTQPLSNQAAALTAAKGAGVRVPQVLALEDAPVVPLPPVLVTEYVAGYVPMPWTTEGRAFMSRLAESGREALIQDLLSIQAVDWRSSGLDSLLLDSDAVGHQRARVERWTRLYRDFTLRQDPLIELVLNRLREDVEPWGEQVLVHGDYRPGNVIYDPESLEVRAIIDWDGTAIGDYHEELGQMIAWPYRANGLACGLFEDEELMATYRGLSGRPVSEAAILYYELQATFRRYLGFAVLARGWRDAGGDLRMCRAWLALTNDRVRLAELLELGA